MYGYNKPHTGALLLFADLLDPADGFCERVRTAYDDPFLVDRFDDVSHFNTAGWWKGTAQMMQGMAGAWECTTSARGRGCPALAATTVVVPARGPARARRLGPSRGWQRAWNR